MNHLESLFDRALDAVVGMDEAGRVIAWNRAAEEIFGWDRHEAVGRSMGDLIVPRQHRIAHSEGLKTYLRTGHGPVLEQRIKVTALRRDGSEFPVELSIFPMKSESGARVFYAFIRSLAAEVAFAREQDLRAAEADAMLRIGHRLLDDVSLDEFTRFCLEEVCVLAGLVAGHMFEVKGQDGARALHATGIWYIRSDRFQPVVEATASIVFARGQGLPGRAWQQEQTVALDDLTADRGFLRMASFAQVGLTKAVAVPVRHGGRIQAVLEFFGTPGSRLDPAILRTLESVGNHIGLAIRRKEAAEYRETLRRELSHRVGNSLAILASIYRNCARRADSVEALSEAFLGRLTSMGQANLVAIRDPGESVGLADLVAGAIAILPDPAQVSVDVARVVIDREWVMPLSLTLHELATNAMKHGGIAEDHRLQIRARISGQPEILELVWQESHDGSADDRPARPIGTGYGTRLIAAMIESKLGGNFDRRLDADGFRFTARLPIATAGPGGHG